MLRIPSAQDRELILDAVQRSARLFEDMVAGDWERVMNELHKGPNRIDVPALDQPVSAVHQIMSDSVSVSQYQAETRQVKMARDACNTPFGLPVDPDV